MQYGTVTGRLLAAVADSPTDVDMNPDEVPLAGRVVFTPSAKALKVVDAGATILPVPIACDLDTEGYLTLNGKRGVNLIATDTTDTNPTGFTYRVSFERLTYDGTPVSYDAFSIAVPAGQTVDLATVAPVAAANGAAIVRGLKGDPGDPGEPAPLSAFDPLRGIRYVAYGHSFGQVQTPANAWSAGLYPVRLREAIDADPALYVNATVNGATMAAIAARAKATWRAGDYGLVTLMGNQNTVGTAHADPAAPEAYKSSLRSFIDTFRTTAYPPTVVLVRDTTCTPTGYSRYGSNPPTDADVDRFNGYLDGVAAEYPSDGSVVVADAASGWDPAMMTCADGQHPNDRGMAHIARAVLGALQGVDYREGQNFGLAPRVPGTYVADDFNRADGAALGTTSVGGLTWVGSAIGGVAGSGGARIASGTAAPQAGSADSLVWVDPGFADGIIQATVSTIGDAGLLFRAADSTNFRMLYLEAGANVYKVAQHTASGYTVTALDVPTKAVNGDVLRVEMLGSGVRLYVNGQLVHTLADTTFQSATRHGLRFGSAASTARFDDFSVSA
jgi:lysophospholipase L1-like esterase